jgi:hypothetical protein
LYIRTYSAGEVIALPLTHEAIHSSHDIVCASLQLAEITLVPTVSVKGDTV